MNQCGLDPFRQARADVSALADQIDGHPVVLAPLSAGNFKLCGFLAPSPQSNKTATTVRSGLPVWFDHLTPSKTIDRRVK
jgi:hypothetical protein